MTKHIKTLILSLFFVISSSRLFADSPITSTDFYKSYLDNTMVMKAHNSGVMNDTIAEYLLNDTIAIDIKAAVINALSWSIDGKDNAPLFVQYIIKKNNLGKAFDMNTLSADAIFCLGYLTIMDDYFQTDKAISILSLARDKKPKSYTVNIILALAEAQRVFDSDWCGVYKVCNEVKKNVSLKTDMRESAISVIFDYINLYKSSCKD
jgi:hypothetical protein